MNRVLLIVAAATLTTVGCATGKPRAHRTAPPDAASLTASHVAGGPVITRLVGRGSVVTVTSTADGPRYSAATKSGEVLVSGATLDELRRRHPDVYRLVQPAVAESAHADNRPPEGQPLADIPQTRLERGTMMMSADRP